MGGIALSQMLARDSLLAAGDRPSGGLQHAPKAKRVIQLFMTGGASPMDTFDYKPELDRLNGHVINEILA